MIVWSSIDIIQHPGSLSELIAERNSDSKLLLGNSFWEFCQNCYPAIHTDGINSSRLSYSNRESMASISASSIEERAAQMNEMLVQSPSNGWVEQMNCNYSTHFEAMADDSSMGIMEDHHQVVGNETQGNIDLGESDSNAKSVNACTGLQSRRVPEGEKLHLDIITRRVPEGEKLHLDIITKVRPTTREYSCIREMTQMSETLSPLPATPHKLQKKLEFQRQKV